MNHRTDDEVILEKIRSLTEKTDLGFKNVCERLDVLNGSVAKHTLKIGMLEKDNIGLNGRLKFEKIIWTLLVAMVGIVATLVGKSL